MMGKKDSKKGGKIWKNPKKEGSITYPDSIYVRMASDLREEQEGAGLLTGFSICKKKGSVLLIYETLEKS